MATGENWSSEEVQATVTDYMVMLRFELLGQPYKKAAHRRALLQILAGRSEAAIELKHQNISAVLPYPAQVMRLAGHARSLRLPPCRGQAAALSATIRS